MAKIVLFFPSHQTMSEHPGCENRAQLRARLLLLPLVVRYRNVEGQDEKKKKEKRDKVFSRICCALPTSRWLKGCSQDTLTKPRTPNTAQEESSPWHPTPRLLSNICSRIICIVFPLQPLPSWLLVLGFSNGTAPAPVTVTPCSSPGLDPCDSSAPAGNNPGTAEPCEKKVQAPHRSLIPPQRNEEEEAHPPQLLRVGGRLTQESWNR